MSSPALPPDLISSLNTAQRSVNFSIAVLLFLLYTLICFLLHSYFLFLRYPLYIVKWVLVRMQYLMRYNAALDNAKDQVNSLISRLQGMEKSARRVTTKSGKKSKKEKSSKSSSEKGSLFMRDFRAHFMNAMWIFCAMRVVVESIRLAADILARTSPEQFPRDNTLSNVGRSLQLGTNWVFFVAFALLIESWLQLIRMYLNKVVIVICRLIIILPMLVFIPISLVTATLIAFPMPTAARVFGDDLSMYGYNPIKLFVNFVLAALVTLLGARIVFAIQSNRNKDGVRGGISAILEMLRETWCCCIRRPSKTSGTADSKGQRASSSTAARRITRCIYIYWVCSLLRIPGIIVIAQSMHINYGIWITFLEFVPEWFALVAVAMVFFPVTISCGGNDKEMDEEKASKAHQKQTECSMVEMEEESQEPGEQQPSSEPQYM